MPRMYAETVAARTRQVVGDVLVVIWIVTWIVVATQLHDLLLVLAIPGEGLADVGTSLASGAERVAGALARAPLVGEGLAAPFGALGDAGTRLANAGGATREAAERLAWWLSVATASGPVAIVAVPYLVWRAAWVRRALAASRLRGDPSMLRVLALRAAVDRPLAELRRASDDPLDDVLHRPEALAALELGRLGLRLRP